MNGFDGTTSGGDAGRLALAAADALEAENVRRLRRLAGLRDMVDEAARRADSRRRLECALRLAPARAA